MKVSVVISAFNEEAKIEECLLSVSKIAEEIIFVDNTSTDKTVQIAKKYTDKVFVRENNTMLNVNKNFGFSKANSEWVLSLDSDERVTEELSKEILELKPSNIDGYYIPRKNIIFGKWIKHTGWYPDPQLRLFRRSKGRFEEKHVHEHLKVEGSIGSFQSPLMHLNYENISQFLNKMIKTYTVNEAENLQKNGYVYNSIDIFRMPISEFMKRYFAESGYKDGMHGLVLSLLQGFYHFVVFLRLWEANNYPEEKDISKIFQDGEKMTKKELFYWASHIKIISEKNAMKKQLLKVKRRLHF